MIVRSIHIDAPAAKVWKALTDPDLIKQWMAEPELELEVHTSWEKGSPFVIKGFHHAHFVNRGTVLQNEPLEILQYNYLSSLSGLADRPEHYTSIAFRLEQEKNQTVLTFSAENFPTEVILKHVDFYWTTTLPIMKKLVERIK